MRVNAFDEPRAWALQWEGSPLFGLEARVPTNGDGRGAAAGVSAPAPQRDPLALPGAETRVPTNGNGTRWTVESRGWALAWDGSALAEIEGRQNGHGELVATPNEEGHTI